MSREIKFRVWDTVTKQYAPVKYTPDELRCEECQDDSDPYRLVYEQFTGLIDSNGTEIYEGDILEFPAMLDGEKLGRCRVFFQDGAFIGNGIMSNRIAHEHCKVIGNIRQNPEYIEEEK